MMRASLVRGRLSPTRSKARSCSTRSSFTCRCTGRSATSSRKSVPPAATSKRPARSRTAPVKAPRTCPNSSLSSSSPGSAPQLTATNGPLRRGERAWIAWATTSLPVPLSPVRSTVASLCSRFSTSRRMRWKRAERPIRPGNVAVASCWSSSAGRSTITKATRGSQTAPGSAQKGAAVTDTSRGAAPGTSSIERQPSRLSPARSSWRSVPPLPKSSEPRRSARGRPSARRAEPSPSRRSRWDEACSTWKEASTQKNTRPREANAEATPASAAANASSSSLR